MSNDIRYTVTTRWGIFSLNEGAYRDYLAGKLWISWNPGGTEPAAAKAEEELPPADLSPEAVRLRDIAARCGILSALQECGADRQFSVPYKSHMKDIPIQELAVSVRSSNGLMRAGARTFGDLMELMQSERGLNGVRNLGIKSVTEITRAFLTETYGRLSPAEKAIYWQNIANRLTEEPSF